MSRSFSVVVAVLLALSVLLSPALSRGQTEFTKFEANPVLSVGPPGSWDEANVVHPYVLFDGSLYRMWYQGGASGGPAWEQGRIGYATSFDGVAWSKFSGNPVLSEGPPGSWDGAGVGRHSVVFDGTTYRMWYMGNRDGLQETNKIGLATSVDGVNWVKYSDNPVISSAPWASAVADPHVVFKDGVYRMYFIGFSAGCGPFDPLIHWCVGLATSPDGINWNIHSTPVLTQGPEGSWDSSNLFKPVVRFDGSRWHMWYTGQPSVGGVPGGRFEIGYTYSSDGIAWTKSLGNPIITVGPSGRWDSVASWMGSIVGDESGFRIWYSGADTLVGENHPRNFRIGLANPTTTFEWSFDDGNIAGWKSIVGWNSEAGRPEHPQDCRIINGEYSLTTCHSLYRLRNFTDFVFEAQVRLVQAAAEPIWGISFRQNPAAARYAEIVAVTGDPYTLAQGYDLEFVGTTLYLFRCEETCTILASASPAIDRFASNRLKVVASGPSIQGFVNDEKVVEITDSTFPSGLIGLFSIPNGCSASGCAAVTSNFDNVKVTPLDGQPGLCSPVPPGLVSWWPGDGNTRDIQNHNDGILQNGASFGPGMVGEAFTFDGIDDYVLIGNPGNLKLSSGITIDAWVNPSATPPLDDSFLSGIYAILTKWDQDPYTAAYGIWLHNPDGYVRLVGGIDVPGVGDRGLRNGGIIPVGEWSHVAMTYDSVTGLNVLYVNGVQATQRMWPGGIAVSDVNVLIGREDSFLPRFFRGSIDEVEIYDRPISPSEIAAIFEAGSSGKCRVPLASVMAEKFFTDSNLNPLPLDQFGNPKMDVVLANGMVRRTNPGQVLAWVNIGNTGGVSLRSLVVNETLPVDWLVHPPWLPPQGGVHVFFQFVSGTRLEITDPATITVTTGNPQTVVVAIPDLTATVAGSGLGPGDTVLLSVKLSYAPVGTSQSASSYPRNYSDTASVRAWTGVASTGDLATATASAFFNAYAKVLGDMNGDFRVDIIDVALVAFRFGTTLKDSRYDLGADLDNNGVIDIRDVAIVAIWFGTSS